MAVVEREDGDGPLLVLVHGAMDRASSFGRMARKLPDRRLLRYDRRGYGGSGAGRGHGLDTHVDDLLLLIAEREAVVFGHSFGGTVALAAAARGATSIRAAVAYESPMPSVAEVTPFPYEETEDPGEVAERFMRAMVGDRIWARLPSGTRSDRRKEGPALIADLSAVRGSAAAIDVAAVTVPVLVAVGGRSGPRTEARGRALAVALPYGRLEVVAEGDHAVHLSDPSGAAALVEELVALGGAEPENGV